MEEPNPYDITITHAVCGAEPCDQTIIHAVAKALELEEVERAQVNVAIVDDREIARLNHKHLNHQGPTDVLSFDLRDDPNPKRDRARIIEGELVISIETAQREADCRRIPVEAELALYTVHGVLHLAGYDDATAEQAAQMRRMEETILASLGIPSVFLTDRTKEKTRVSESQDTQKGHRQSVQAGQVRCRKNDSSALEKRSG